MDFTGILAIIGVFGSIIIFIYMYFSSRNKERMALIESGQDANMLNSYRDRSSSLKYGLVAIMLGIGILAGNVLQNWGVHEETAFFSMILIFGGAGLLIYYLLMGRKDSTEKIEREYREKEVV
ncbi:MAG: DUF6249 domain-containing protein [Saprospiraceae bacterium]|nr:DUF6249 domain-containing protein [Saprospiraceae bacterium]